MDVRNQGDVRLGDSRQTGDLPRMVGTKLGDDDLIVRPGTQQRQRKADVIVEALLRLMGAKMPAENDGRSAGWWFCPPSR